MLRGRRLLIVVIGGAAIIALTTVVWAQQPGVQLAEGDDLTISCPTTLTIEFYDQGGAVVSCSPEIEGP